MEKELVSFMKKELSNSYKGTQYQQSLCYLLSGKAANKIELMQLCRCLMHQYNKLLLTEHANPYSVNTASIYVRLHYFRKKVNTEVQKLL